MGNFLCCFWRRPQKKTRKPQEFKACLTRDNEVPEPEDEVFIASPHLRTWVREALNSQEYNHWLHQKLRENSKLLQRKTPHPLTKQQEGIWSDDLVYHFEMLFHITYASYWGPDCDADYALLFAVDTGRLKILHLLEHIVPAYCQLKLHPCDPATDQGKEEVNSEEEQMAVHPVDQI